MGANDRILRGFIPKELVGDAASWEFAPLLGEAVRASGADRLLSERERRAFERGLAKGRAEGQQQAAQQRASHAQQLDLALNTLRARFAELEAGGADATLDLALAVARHVIRREVHVAHDAVLPALREALALVIDQHSQPRVLLNPQDLELIRADLDADGMFKGCRFSADPTLARGGCRVETAQGEIDARLGTRWQRVLDALGIDRTASTIED
jgi:flagellar assembly protein FliH